MILVVPIAPALLQLLRPCVSCGFWMRSRHRVPMCGDCREYGPPTLRRSWRRPW
jgi:hypothetical protein